MLLLLLPYLTEDSCNSAILKLIIIFINRYMNTTCYESNRINGTACYEAWCRNILGHGWMEKSVQLAALRRRDAPPAFTDYWALMNGKVGATYHPLAASCTSGVYRLFGTDGWTSRCNLPPSGGKLHLRHLPIIAPAQRTLNGTK